MAAPQDGNLIARHNQRQQPRQISIPDRTVTGAGKNKKRHTKVRTGCLTCKIRRVKCDEQKPVCQRCINFGVDCEGYSHNTKAKAKTKAIASSRPIRPKTLRSLQPLYYVHSGLRFEDEQEGRCFCIYIEKVAPQIPGLFKSALWDQLIPQTCVAEPFIKHAIVAIGAMGKIMHDQRFTRAVPRMAAEYPFALNQFGKALRGMRTAFSNRDTDIRKALIACILVFCFETLVGKPGSALTNTESGLMLLYQWMKADPTYRTSFFLGRQRRYQCIEEDVMIALGSLDIHVLFLLDNRPIAVHRFMIEGANKTIAEMPPAFSSLKVLTNFWCLIMRRNHHFIKLALVLGKSELSGGPWKYDEKNAPWADSISLNPGGNIFCAPREPAMDLIPESVQYREDVKRWSQASSQVFNIISVKGSKEDKVLCALLQVYQIMNDIMLQGVFFTSETAYDQFVSEFGRMMFLIKYVHPHVSNTSDALYFFDLGIIAPLYFVGLRCRDKAIRDEVIDVMSKVHYREGMWDSFAAGKLVQWIGELEESGRDENGFVPEHKRVILTSAFMDLEGKRAIVQAAQPSSTGRVIIEQMINWT